MAIKYLSFFIIPVAYSNSTGREATARAVTKSNFSRCVLAKSSILEWIATIFSNFNFSITIFRKLILLFKESTKVTFKLGNNIFITIPGKPAPVPKSQKLSILFKSITFTMVALS